MEGPWEARGRHIGRRMAPPPTAYQTVDKQNCRRTNFTFETFVCRDRSKGQLGGPFKTMSHAGSLSCHFGGEGRGEGKLRLKVHGFLFKSMNMGIGHQLSRQLYCMFCLWRFQIALLSTVGNCCETNLHSMHIL